MAHEPLEVVQHLVGLAVRLYGPALLADTNVVGFGCGEKEAHGEKTGRYGLTVFVMKKVPPAYLPLSVMVPRRLHVGRFELETDVVETGPFYPLVLNQRQRPARGGVSIGHVRITAGTLGCLVRDRQDGSLQILSNNHVLANQNDAQPGDPIVQPGRYDGGRHPDDTIARLTRFVPIYAEDEGVNRVDAAIARPLRDDMVVNEMNLDLAPPGPDHRVVGLLFAGSCNSMVMNPIDRVLQELDVRMLVEDATTPGELGMHVEKVGRTSEYTTSTIRAVDATVRVQYDFGTALFTDQLVTYWMSEGGDSGSIVFAGGAGGQEDRCGCPTVAAMVDRLGLDLRSLEAAARLFRDQRLRATAGGRILVRAYYRIEPRLLELEQQLNQRERARVRRFVARIYRRLAQGASDAGLREVFVDADLARDLNTIEAILKKRLPAKEFARIAPLFRLVRRWQGRTLDAVLRTLDAPRTVQVLRRWIPDDVA